MSRLKIIQNYAVYQDPIHGSFNMSMKFLISAFKPFPEFLNHVKSRCPIFTFFKYIVKGKIL